MSWRSRLSTRYASPLTEHLHGFDKRGHDGPASCLSNMFRSVSSIRPRQNRAQQHHAKWPGCGFSRPVLTHAFSWDMIATTFGVRCRAAGLHGRRLLLAILGLWAKFQGINRESRHLDSHFVHMTGQKISRILVTLTG